MSSTFGCPHCGRTNPLNATFCASCGTYLKGLDAETLSLSTAPVPPDEGDSQPRADGERTASDLARSQPWLRPDFEIPPSLPEEALSTLSTQPWLQLDEETQAPSAPESTPQRLIAGLQGLIEPVELAHDLLRPDSPPPVLADVADLSYELRRELRQTFATDLPILDDPVGSTPRSDQPLHQGLGLWRRNGIYGLLFVGILLALWVGNAPPGLVLNLSNVSRPHSWPGVAEAYRAIDSLPANSVVLVNWAYDPTAAGEMDLAALPVIEHLLEKNARLLVVSQLPGGSATARRLIAVARSRASQAGLTRQLGESLVEGGYLPGGIGSLSLLGQSPTQAIPVDMQGRSLENRPTLTTLEENAPALLLVLAFRSEDVQRWLEQVQPLNAAPVVVVSSAAIDPAIRPYVDSGQIVGLVSGYAGGIAYGDLLTNVVPTQTQESQRRQINGQNWALAVLLLVIVMGNLSGLAERREP
jgi:hypothetical protein